MEPVSIGVDLDVVQHMGPALLTRTQGLAMDRLDLDQSCRRTQPVKLRFYTEIQPWKWESAEVTVNDHDDDDTW